MEDSEGADHKAEDESAARSRETVAASEIGTVLFVDLFTIPHCGTINSTESMNS